MDPKLVLRRFWLGLRWRWARWSAPAPQPPTAPGVRVFAFDPTPDSSAWVREQSLPLEFKFLPHGVADYDGVARFYPPVEPGYASLSLIRRGTADNYIEAPVRRVVTLARELGHRHIDILKMDIEGAEYGVIEDVLRSRLDIAQIVVEFQHRLAEIGPERTRRAVALLNRHLYRAFYVSADDREYGFLHL